MREVPDRIYKKGFIHFLNPLGRDVRRGVYLVLTSVMRRLAQLLFSLLDSLLHVCLHLNELFLQTRQKIDTSTDNKAYQCTLH